MGFYAEGSEVISVFLSVAAPIRLDVWYIEESFSSGEKSLTVLWKASISQSDLLITYRRTCQSMGKKCVKTFINTTLLDVQKLYQGIKKKGFSHLGMQYLTAQQLLTMKLKKFSVEKDYLIIVTDTSTRLAEGK